MGTIPKKNIRLARTSGCIHFHADKAGVDFFNPLYLVLMCLHHLMDFIFGWQLIARKIMIAIIQNHIIESSSKEPGQSIKNQYTDTKQKYQNDKAF